MTDRRIVRLGWVMLCVIVLFRAWFSAVLPMTGDEAYFVLWGERPAGGYYDHSPMIGWWLAGLLNVSRDEWVLRLPSTLLPFLLSWGGWWLVRPSGFERARLAAVLILLLPANVWNVLLTTDTPVVLFSQLSILAYVAALRSARSYRLSLSWHAVAGGLLGLAFLGKYFAALLGIAYFVHVLFVRRDARRWSGFLALSIVALPAPIYNLWWNSGHCWVNVLFNFVNRHGTAGVTWVNPALYLLSLLYLATPWLLLALWRERRWVRDVVRRDESAGAVLWLMGLPLVLFALLSVGRSVGLHWMLSFIPLLVVLAAISVPLIRLERLIFWSAGLAVLHGLIFIVMMVLPIQTWQKTPYYEGIVLSARSDDLLAHLRPYKDHYLFSMESYSSAAILAYHASAPVAVFGAGSFHARQDDFLTDWQAQEGRNVLVLRKSKPEPGEYAAYFQHVEVQTFTVEDAHYWIVLGQGFNYSAYHALVLTRIRDRYYRVPAWLPQRACDFCERYFPEETKTGR